MIEGKLIDGYIEHCERERRLDRKTLRAYRVDLEQFAEWASRVEDPLSCEAVRDLAAVELLIATGVRVAELCALDVASLDLEGRAMRVHGKGGRERVAFLEDGVDIRNIQQLLGHSSLRTTEIYTHVTSASLRRVMRVSNPRGAIDA